MRFLDEDPGSAWRALKKALPKTKLQMLLRGQNILATETIPMMFWTSSAKSPLKNGIDVVRNLTHLTTQETFSRP
jgi:oxaloacetate decarboxylase alpha subunit